MKKEQFKKLIKPIIQECLQEALVESNLLSGIISEVVRGYAAQPPVEKITEQKEKYESDAAAEARRLKKQQKLKETREALLGAINKDAYGGVDLFEGTTPMSSQGSTKSASAQSSLSGVDPNDAGVDISGILNIGGDKWSKLV
tara:strand:+ start:6977 stop:7405 length:429 start_codon:yes stop_codon:yes gene_type:complete